MCKAPPNQVTLRPIREVDARCDPGASLGLSPGEEVAFCFDHWTVTRVVLAADQGAGRLPLPRAFRGEKVYDGVHVEKNVWLLALARDKDEYDRDGFWTRFVLFDFATDTIKADWAAHKDIARALAVAPRQGWLITGGTFLEDRTLCLWDRKTLKKVGEVDLRRELHLGEARDGNYLRCMDIDPSARYLGLGMDNGAVWVWDLGQKRWHPVLPVHHGPALHRLRFLDSHTLAVVSIKAVDEYFLNVYDWETGKLRFRVKGKYGLTDPAATPDGRVMAVGDWVASGGWVRLWDVRAGKEIAAFKAYGDGVSELIFNRDGRRLITEDHDAIIKVWDVGRFVSPAER